MTIDDPLGSIENRLGSIEKSQNIIIGYLKNVDKYPKFSFVTYRWVKSLTISSGVCFLLLTGLSSILTSARVFQGDILSLLALVFASGFGMTFKSYMVTRSP